MCFYKRDKFGESTVLRSIAGVFGISSQLVGLTTLLVTLSVSPWFSWTENYLSVLGVEGSAATLFNYGLILTGVFSLVFAVGLGKSLLSGRLLGQSGMVSLILGSIAISAMGIFPRTTGLPHDCASLAFFTFITLGILLVGVMAITASQVMWGALSLTACFLIIVLQPVQWLWEGRAIQQLLSCLPWSLWTIVFGIRLLVRPKLVNV
jgi:hypothetical membrane protein